MNFFWLKCELIEDAMKYPIIEFDDKKWSIETVRALRRLDTDVLKKEAESLVCFWEKGEKTESDERPDWAFEGRMTPICSDRFFTIISKHTPDASWLALSRLTESPNDARKWGIITGLKNVDVLDIEESTMMHRLLVPILDPLRLPAPYPDIFRPTGANAVFVSEKVRAEIIAARFSGVRFELVPGLG